jgi:hypothetical protein
LILKNFWFLRCFFCSTEYYPKKPEKSILISAATLVLIMNQYLRKIMCASVAAMAVAGCGKKDSPDPKEGKPRSAIYAALCANDLHCDDLEHMIGIAKENDELYRMLVDDVVYTMRTNPDRYKDELLDCSASAFSEYQSEAADLFGFIYTKKAMENLGIRRKEDEREWAY